MLLAPYRAQPQPVLQFGNESADGWAKVLAP